jgi:hypothetical protein
MTKHGISVNLALLVKGTPHVFDHPSHTGCGSYFSYLCVGWHLPFGKSESPQIEKWTCSHVDSSIGFLIDPICSRIYIKEKTVRFNGFTCVEAAQKRFLVISLK